MENQIYSSWAFTENEHQKRDSNIKAYDALKDKSIVVYGSKLPIAEDVLKSKSVLLDYKHGYGHTDYKILSNPNNLSTLELALVCDRGNLCFGYSTSGSIITISTD